MREKIKVAQEKQEKATRKRRKINLERETKVINHFADVPPEETFAVGVRIFEILGLLVPNED